MAGERGAHAVLGDDALEVVDEVAQALGGDRRVLDERGRPLGARRAHEQRQDGAAQGGRLGKRGGSSVGDAAPRRGSATRACRRARPSRASSSSPWYSTVSIACSSRRGAAQDGRRRRVRRAAQRRQVEQLDRRRARPQDGDVGLESAAQAGEGQGRADAHARPRVEFDLELGEQRQRALGSRQKAREVGLGRAQLAQVVARRATGRAGNPVAMASP